MRGATLEVRLEELGVLRSFSRPRVNNDNPYSESLFLTVKYRPNYPNRPFSSIEEACQWVSSFVDWYNHQRSRVYELARNANPRRWSGALRYWRQPEVVWINLPANDFIAHTAKVELVA